MIHDCVPIQNIVATEITFMFDSSSIPGDDHLEKILDKIEDTLQKRENYYHVKIIFK